MLEPGGSTQYTDKVAGAKGGGSIPGSDRDRCLHERVHTGCRTPPASRTMDQAGSFRDK
jgi:hypothetical protein